MASVEARLIIIAVIVVTGLICVAAFYWWLGRSGGVTPDDQAPQETDSPPESPNPFGASEAPNPFGDPN